MPKDYLRFLESSCKNFQKENKSVCDILIYGSFVKGKGDFNDIDLMLIFDDIPLKDRLQNAQNLKNILKKEIKNVDVKTMNFKDFLDESFLARQGLLVEGKSLIKNKALSELLGFKGYSLFTYSLKNLDHNKKTQFTYALSGRNSEGLLKLLKGLSLGRGVVQMPIENSIEFEHFLQRWGVNYKRKDILESNL